jgi:type IV pilus biogenesis protein CpaD/CtpE
MSRRMQCPQARLAVIALAGMLAACAQTPTTEPVSSLPEKVIRNVPATRTAHQPTTQLLPLSTYAPPLDDAMPPLPIV